LTNDCGRIDGASRIMRATPAAVFACFVDATALMRWLPPRGARADLERFDPRAGGAMHLTLHFVAKSPGGAGKTTENSDRVVATFGDIVPNERVEWKVRFDSKEARFAGEMLMTWTFAGANGGTKVSVEARNVPAGIDPKAHLDGLNSSLENLASYLEQARA